jgi:hypothetical protein
MRIADVDVIGWVCQQNGQSNAGQQRDPVSPVDFFVPFSENRKQ